MAVTLTLEIQSVDALAPYPNNPKKHTDIQIDAICDSIRMFGFKDPIGVRPDGTILEGEGRWLAAKKMGMEEVQTVVVAGLTDRQADMYRIAHNKTALSSGFDMDKLVESLREITGTGQITLADLGFSDKSARNVLSSFGLENTQSDEARAARAPKYAFEIVWDTDEQKAKFDRLMEVAQSSYPDLDAASSLMAYIDASGVMAIEQEETHVEQLAT